MNDPDEELRAALRGLDYPATRNKLVCLAMENGGSPDVIARLLEYPETADFINEDALASAFGVRIPGTHPHGWE